MYAQQMLHERCCTLTRAGLQGKKQRPKDAREALHLSHGPQGCLSCPQCRTYVCILATVYKCKDDYMAASTRNRTKALCLEGKNISDLTSTDPGRRQRGGVWWRLPRRKPQPNVWHGPRNTRDREHQSAQLTDRAPGTIEGAAQEPSRIIPIVP